MPDECGVEWTEEALEFNITVEEIKGRLKPIHEEAWRGDGGADLANDLYLDVLLAIANGAKKPRKLAKAAIKAQEIRADGLFWKMCIE